MNPCCLLKAKINGLPPNHLCVASCQMLEKRCNTKVFTMMSNHMHGKISGRDHENAKLTQTEKQYPQDNSLPIYPSNMYLCRFWKKSIRG